MAILAYYDSSYTETQANQSVSPCSRGLFEVSLPGSVAPSVVTLGRNVLSQEMTRTAKSPRADVSKASGEGGGGLQRTGEGGVVCLYSHGPFPMFSAQLTVAGGNGNISQFSVSRPLTPGLPGYLYRPGGRGPPNGDQTLFPTYFLFGGERCCLSIQR